MEARNARFDEISDELSRRYLGSDEYMNAICETFPDPEERHAFCRYDLELSLPHLTNPSGILTPARFRPWIPLGYENTTLYRLLPSIHNLTPQKIGYPLTDYEVLDPAFLGVIITGPPREPSLHITGRALNLSEESTQSAESDDADALGFVFHEFGVLQSLECETANYMPTTLDEGDDCEGDWEPTGFCVVARLSDTGRVNGIYVIYNMNLHEEDWGQREQVTHGKWGIQPSSPGDQFSCARIGNTVQDFGFENQLAWTDSSSRRVGVGSEVVNWVDSTLERMCSLI